MPQPEDAKNHNPSMSRGNASHLGMGTSQSQPYTHTAASCCSGETNDRFCFVQHKVSPAHWPAIHHGTPSERMLQVHLPSASDPDNKQYRAP